MKRQPDITLFALAGALSRSQTGLSPATEEFHSSRTDTAGGVQVQPTSPPHSPATLLSCHWLSDAAERSAIFTVATCVISSGFSQVGTALLLWSDSSRQPYSAIYSIRVLSTMRLDRHGSFSGD